LKAARVPRAIARILAGRTPAARATADFLVTTITRNRAQQTPIAINAAIGLTLAVIVTTWFGGTLAAFSRPRTLTLSIPLVLAFWATVGMKAAFYVPSELPAAWMFRANAPNHSGGYRSAVCASIVACIGPPAVVMALLVLLPARDLYASGRHAAFVLLLVIMLAEILTATIDFMPFTRPYRAGHARLRTRWPLYVFGTYLFADAAARIELWTWRQDRGFLILVACIVGVIGVLEMVGRRMEARLSVEVPDNFGEDENAVTVLDLSAVASAGPR
jgi:hypothetical protein